MKVHRVTLYIVDFDQLGPEGVAEELVSARYANRCISPNVLRVETREIGEWDESNPLNRASTADEEIKRIFDKQETTP